MSGKEVQGTQREGGGGEICTRNSEGRGICTRNSEGGEGGGRDRYKGGGEICSLDRYQVTFLSNKITIDIHTYHHNECN